MDNLNIDSQWNENLEKIQGKAGIHILVNDRGDVISRLIKALADVEGLPEDLDNPESIDEANAVDSFATVLNHLFCEGAEISEALMVGEQVEKAYNDIQDETGNTRDMHDETSHSDGDF